MLVYGRPCLNSDDVNLYSSCQDVCCNHAAIFKVFRPKLQCLEFDVRYIIAKWHIILHYMSILLLLHTHADFKTCA